MVVAAVVLGLLVGWFAHPLGVVVLTSRWDVGLFDTTVLILRRGLSSRWLAWTLFALAVEPTVNAVAITALPARALPLLSAIPLAGSFPSRIECVLRVAPAVARTNQLSDQPRIAPAEGRRGFGVSTTTIRVAERHRAAVRGIVGCGRAGGRRCGRWRGPRSVDRFARPWRALL